MSVGIAEEVGAQASPQVPTLPGVMSADYMAMAPQLDVSSAALVCCLLCAKRPHVQGRDTLKLVLVQQDVDALELALLL